jgi:hypothetical protein
MKDTLAGVVLAIAILGVAVITGPLFIKFLQWWVAFLGL